MANATKFVNDCVVESLPNNSVTWGDALCRFHKIMSVTIPIVITSLLVVGVLGNSLVIWVTFTTERVIKHRVYSILVVNLAVADLIYLLASGPYQAVANSVPGWIYGSILCYVLHYVNIQTMAVSIFTMCSLALMRFAGLILPYQFRDSCVSTSRRFAGAAIVVVVWVLGSIIALPNLAYFKYSINNDSGLLETCEWEGLSADAHYSFVLLTVTYVIPFLLVTTFYVVISRQILSRSRRNRVESLRTTMMVFSLIIAFLVCWLPHHLYRMMLASRVYTLHTFMLTSLEAVGHCLSYAHACVNPIIYTFAAPGFRKNLCCSFRTPCKRIRNSSNSVSSRNILKLRSHQRFNVIEDHMTQDASYSKVTSPTVTQIDLPKLEKIGS